MSSLLVTTQRNVALNAASRLFLTSVTHLIIKDASETEAALCGRYKVELLDMVKNKLKFILWLFLQI